METFNHCFATNNRSLYIFTVVFSNRIKLRGLKMINRRGSCCCTNLLFFKRYTYIFYSMPFVYNDFVHYKLRQVRKPLTHLTNDEVSKVNTQHLRGLKRKKIPTSFWICSQYMYWPVFHSWTDGEAVLPWFMTLCIYFRMAEPRFNNPYFWPPPPAMPGQVSNSGIHTYLCTFRPEAVKSSHCEFCVYRFIVVVVVFFYNVNNK